MVHDRREWLRRASAMVGCAVAGAIPAIGAARPEPTALDAPNVVPIHAHLVTSGQPSAAAIARLGSLGFRTVIYLAPDTVEDAVPQERALLEAQGVVWVR